VFLSVPDYVFDNQSLEILIIVLDLRVLNKFAFFVSHFISLKSRDLI